MRLCHCGRDRLGARDPAADMVADVSAALVAIAGRGADLVGNS